MVEKATAEGRGLWPDNGSIGPLTFRMEEMAGRGSSMVCGRRRLRWKNGGRLARKWEGCGHMDKPRSGRTVN